MLARALFLLLVLSLVATIGVAESSAQAQRGDLNELWESYPLDPPQEGPREVGAREEKGSTAGPPPEPPGRAGPFPLALLFLSLALAVVGIAGAVYQAVVGMRERPRANLDLADAAEPPPVFMLDWDDPWLTSEPPAESDKVPQPRMNRGPGG
jgi:hypothetical protein